MCLACRIQEEDAAAAAAEEEPTAASQIATTRYAKAKWRTDILHRPKDVSPVRRGRQPSALVQRMLIRAFCGVYCRRIARKEAKELLARAVVARTTASTAFYAQSPVISDCSPPNNCVCTIKTMPRESAGRVAP